MAGAAVGVLGGGGVTFLVALAFRPASHDGWEDLGWAVYTLAACAAVALVCGAAGIYVALRRAGAVGAAATAAAFVVAGPLLAIGGPLVVAAPAAARWMALGLVEWGTDAGGQPGTHAVPPDVTSGAGRRRAVPQRIALWSVISTVGVLVLTNELGHDLGGRIGGTAMVWAAAAVVPTVAALILWRAVPLRMIAALAAVAVMAAGVAAQRSTQDVHPTRTRLAEMGRELDVPDGLRVARRASALASPGPPELMAPRGLSPQPVEMLLSVGQGDSVPPFPAPLTPGRGDLLPGVALVVDSPPLPAAREAAARWEQSLRREGWSAVPGEALSGTIRLCQLPRPAIDYVAANGGQLFERGPWQRGVVVPFESGAIVLLCTRP